MTQEEAQNDLDPLNDPGVVLHHLPDGSWLAFQISYLGGLPESIETSEDFARFDVEQRIETGELPAGADVATQISREEEQLGCIAEQSLDLKPGEPLPIGCEGEPG